ncbi:bifunctional phosphoribosyl-AMP cyclohydrolase/phosphoribosyl-ATP diphosphatase HisIE [Facilibium subflavum]|uniref:bifunctional phosphoribosyl-AMP cyclohydrolase/phosphoribosyl-ATP diphosphatase HisIE n=1 Tax=Facilibium subflavum TaxID=2219058 RepID=UPI001F166CE9|nr:bifunctional phosphoribosyl-AMP cyclohydrolase/phosphoribosyl-ATP diphosphatase HisIE [Facilibium subflavum]
MLAIKNTLIDEIDWGKMNNLVPAIVQCHLSGKVLMLGYMNQEALQQTVKTRQVTFYSRAKKRLWRKGETSGNVLQLIDIAMDCDGDSLIVLVAAQGPTCHKGTQSCFERGFKNQYDILLHLERIIESRKTARPAGSYVTNLFDQGLARIAQKVGEEGVETVIAAMKDDLNELKEESADLLFHLLILLAEKNVRLSDILQVLARR